LTNGFLSEISVDGYVVLLLCCCRNKDREKNRIHKLQQFKETGVWPSATKEKRKMPTIPWSETKERKQNRKVRRERRKVKKQKVSLKW
jgi:hypothetical protein